MDEKFLQAQSKQLKKAFDLAHGDKPLQRMTTEELSEVHDQHDCGLENGCPVCEEVERRGEEIVEGQIEESRLSEGGDVNILYEKEI